MTRLKLSGLLFWILVATASAAEPDASREYDKAVTHVWGQILSTGYTVDWCNKNAPRSKSELQKAYAAWNARFATLIADINRRVDAVMNPEGAFSPEEFAAKKADLIKRGADRFGANANQQDLQQAKSECAKLPAYFATPAFDLESLFSAELALIRAHAAPP